MGISNARVRPVKGAAPSGLDGQRAFQDLVARLDDIRGVLVSLTAAIDELHGRDALIVEAMRRHPAAVRR